jgi:hypothetical protein
MRLKTRIVPPDGAAGGGALAKDAQQTGVFVVFLFWRKGFGVVGFVCAIFFFVCVVVLVVTAFRFADLFEAPLGGGHLVGEESVADGVEAGAVGRFLALGRY